VAGYCECGVEPTGFGARELVYQLHKFILPCSDCSLSSDSCFLLSLLLCWIDTCATVTPCLLSPRLCYSLIHYHEAKAMSICYLKRNRTLKMMFARESRFGSSYVMNTCSEISYTYQNIP
jgi:hypothetical protein